MSAQGAPDPRDHLHAGCREACACPGACGPRFAPGVPTVWGRGQDRRPSGATGRGCSALPSDDSALEEAASQPMSGGQASARGGCSPTGQRPPRPGAGEQWRLRTALLRPPRRGRTRAGQASLDPLVSRAGPPPVGGVCMWGGRLRRPAGGQQMPSGLGGGPAGVAPPAPWTRYPAVW